ncbi:MAG: LamG-like jellyroll fold domain-containing protein [Patescibacteria group bacterium]
MLKYHDVLVTRISLKNPILKVSIVLALVAVGGFGCAGLALAQTDTNALILSLQKQVLELLKQIQTLQQEVGALKSEAGFQATSPSPILAPSDSSRVGSREVEGSPVSETEEIELPEFTRSLSLGARGDDVRKLQEFLARDRNIYPEGLTTGYYGPKTAEAVRRWQRKNNIEAVGAVGPKTIAKFRELGQAPLRQGYAGQGVVRGLIEQGAGRSGMVPPGLLTAPGVQRQMASTTPTIMPPMIATATPVITTPSTSSGQATTTMLDTTPTSPIVSPPTAASPQTSNTSTAPTSSSSTTPTSSSTTTATATTSTTTAAAATVTIPARPLDLSASILSNSPLQLTLKWQDKSDNEQAFHIYRRSGGGSWLLLAQVEANTKTYPDTNIPDTEPSYEYKVNAINSAGSSTDSNYLTVVTKAPTAPSNLNAALAADSVSRVNLTWTDNSTTETEFGIYRGNAGSNNRTILFRPPTNTTSYSDEVSTPGAYEYTVTACVQSQQFLCSDQSSPITITIPEPPRIPPIGHWKFDGNGNNEVAGGSSAVIVGNATFNSTGGRFGGYAYIPSQGDSIKIPYNTIFDLANSFTIEFWFRQRSNQSFAQDLVYKGTPINNYNFRIFRQLWNEYNLGPIIVGYTAVNTGYWSQTSNPNQLSHGSWHHVAYTRNASEAAYYLDGALIHSLNLTQYPEYSGPAKTPAVDIIIGGSAVDTDIDNLRIYDRSLSLIEVSQNMGIGLKNNTTTAALAAALESLRLLVEQFQKLLRK